MKFFEVCTGGANSKNNTNTHTVIAVVLYQNGNTENGSMCTEKRDSMENIMRAVKILIEEDGGKSLTADESLVGVFKDCVITVRIENQNLKTEVVLDPYYFNEAVFGQEG